MDYELNAELPGLKQAGFILATASLASQRLTRNYWIITKKYGNGYFDVQKESTLIYEYLSNTGSVGQVNSSNNDLTKYNYVLCILPGAKILDVGDVVRLGFYSNNLNRPYIKQVIRYSRGKANLNYEYDPIDWYQGLVNKNLNCFLNGDYTIPETAVELISPLNTTSEEGAGMGRCLGVVSIGPAWVHCYYVANASFTGFDKIRVKARSHINDSVLWTYDISISTITNATNTSIPTTSNLFWDEELSTLFIVDFRFYAVSIPDPLLAPTGFVERNQTARRGAGYASNGVIGSIFHHTGSGANLYKYVPSTGFTAAVATTNFNTAWPSGWNPHAVFQSSYLDTFRHFNRSWPYLNNKWYTVLSARANNGDANGGKSQVKLFTVDVENETISNKTILTLDQNSVSVIPLSSVSNYYLSAAQATPSPYMEGPLSNHILHYFVGNVGPTRYTTSFQVNYAFNEESVSEVTGWTELSSAREYGPQWWNQSAVNGVLSYAKGNEYHGILLCPRVCTVTETKGEGTGRYKIYDPISLNQQTNVQPLIPGMVSSERRNELVLAWVELVLISWHVGTFPPTGSNRVYTSVTPTVGKLVDGVDTQPAAVTQVANVLKFGHGYRTCLVWIDPVAGEVTKRLEISNRGLGFNGFLGPTVINNTDPMPIPVNVWQLAMIENGPFEGTVITLQDYWQFDKPWYTDPMLQFKIIQEKAVSYESAPFGPPQGKVTGNSNSLYNDKNIYQYCCFRIGNNPDQTRNPQVGTPQLRVISPTDGSSPVLIIGVWSERITDGDVAANWDNDHFRADIWIYRLDLNSFTEPVVLLKHLTESKKTITEFTLPRGSDFERMTFSNGSLKYVNFQNNTRKLLKL